MLYHGNDLKIGEYVSEKEKVYDGNDGLWRESEDFVWAIQEYICGNGIDGEVILWLLENDLSVGDFEEEISVEYITEQLIDGIKYNAAEINHIIEWLYEYMTANDMSLNELNDMCWKNSSKVFDMIF